MSEASDRAFVDDPASATGQRAAAVLARCRAEGLTLATAESCTGGLIAAALTAIEGSSDVVDRAFVTYSNAAKSAMLGVPPDLIAARGAVSEAVVRAMAEGALWAASVDLAVAASGIAGPGGAVPGKPVGTVHLALARRDRPTRHRAHLFPGDRAAVRAASVRAALDLILEELGDAPGGGAT